MTQALKAKAAIVGAVLAMAAAHGAQACAASRLTSVSGPVMAVPSAGVICVALGPRPEQWVRVRLAAAGTEPPGRQRLMAAAFAKHVDCVLGAGGGWRCRLESGDLAALAGSPEVGLVAAAWR